MNIIDDMNYYSDHRTRARDKGKWYATLDERRMIATVNDIIQDIMFETSEEPFDGQVPFTWEVCPTCEGKGSHVNPSIDCNGLTAMDFHEDPDLAENYCSGLYDVPCYRCNGRRVVPVCADEEVSKAIDQYYEAEAQSHAEMMAERRMGA